MPTQLSLQDAKTSLGIIFLARGGGKYILFKTTFYPNINNSVVVYWVLIVSETTHSL